MVSMRYMIRRAGPEQLAGVAACLAAAFERHRSLYTEGAFDDTVPTVQGLTQRMETMVILCASAHAQVVGTIACGVTAPGEGHLRGMAVLPDFQGRGIADDLLAAAESELRGLECSRITLDTTRPLIRARRFYEKHGYTATNKVTDFFGMPLFEYEKYL